ncbi:DUF4347 domain-containing protein [Planktothrix sp. FACHB-1355]|uniref:DUF4347 domain-containing protein n=1 Tax=Aerosakkonema funiforme FACHB-1375 TaxID=2949571 RepID=A0A926ZKV9_9CYAN|nr:MULTISPECIES: DUF4347 domain-containing protein [Oscillatoriales]MBD2186485.1 DUF4347 domain-containing protein [Aerosakkonema funiforme FACHB-1375]MBD3561723.1 DUF4347 domain-containing protein [Planktothrix sp. FACHB-1355]
MPDNINTSSQPNSIVFIDSTVPDYQSLAAAVAPGTDVIIIYPTGDEINQISDILADRHNINAVHIISHGSPGSLQFGNSQLNEQNLHLYANQLQQWRNSLSINGDIFLYGCDVAAGDNGIAFVQQLSELTGADVAASDDLTGSAALDGDWDLEVKSGLIEAPLAFQVGVMEAYNAVLGTTINVTNVTELIQAINDANSESGAYVGADTINLAAGTYTLTSGTYNYFSGIDWGNSGLPVITSEITINGNGATIARDNSASTTFRLFTIGGASGKLTLNDVTLENGNVTGSTTGAAPDAGAISNISGIVNINNSTLRNNAAGDDGGAIANFGTMNIQNSTITNNTAQGDGGSVDGGGAIENDGASATLNLTNTTISGNIHNGSGIGNGQGGAIRNRNSAKLNIVNSTIFNNTANSSTGGGIFVESGTVTVKNSIVIGNTATTDADVSGTFTSNNANIIGNVGSSSGFGSDITGVTAASVLDPTLANNGGSTLTHALIAGSPAIDAGNNASVPAGITTDQRGTGYPRIFGTAVDIGAFEYSLTTISLTVTDANADETASNTGTYRISRGTANTGDLTVNLNIDPSSTVTSNTGGTFPVDYSFSVTNGGNISGTGTTRTLTIPDGQTFVDLILNPIDDNYGEAAETLKLNLAAGS